MDRFHEMAVFVAVAIEGSFTAAAKRLDMSAPAVTRAVAGLEARLGIQMLCRTTRHVRMTTAGEQYLDDARPILEDLGMADESILGAPDSPCGEVSIAVPTCISRHLIPPIVAEYLKNYPDAQVSVVSVDRPMNLEEESFDLSICFGSQPESVPHEVVGKIRDVYCATPTYLNTHGRPKSPADLDSHILIDNPAREPARQWAFQKAGKRISMTATPRISLTNLDACLAAMSCDFGIAQSPSYQISERVASGDYELILEDFEAPPYAINVVRRPVHLQTARANVFFEFLVERLTATSKLRPIENTTKNQHKLTLCKPDDLAVPLNVELMA